VVHIALVIILVFRSKRYNCLNYILISILLVSGAVFSALLRYKFSYLRCYNEETFPFFLNISGLRPCDTTKGCSGEHSGEF